MIKCEDGTWVDPAAVDAVQVGFTGRIAVTLRSGAELVVAGGPDDVDALVAFLADPANRP